jgi:hypothetical protein
MARQFARALGIALLGSTASSMYPESERPSETATPSEVDGDELCMLHLPKEAVLHRAPQQPKGKPAEATDGGSAEPSSADTRSIREVLIASLVEGLRRPVLGGNLLHVDLPSKMGAGCQPGGTPEPGKESGGPPCRSSPGQVSLLGSTDERHASSQRTQLFGLDLITILLLIGIICGGLACFYVYRMGGSWKEVQEHPTSVFRRAGAEVASGASQSLASKEQDSSRNPFYTAPVAGQPRKCLGVPVCC